MIKFDQLLFKFSTIWSLGCHSENPWAVYLGYCGAGFSYYDALGDGGWWWWCRAVKKLTRLITMRSKPEYIETALL